MKGLFICLLLTFGLTSFVVDDGYVFTDGGSFMFRKIDQTSFKEGEQLDYTIHYGLIDAGSARLELKDAGIKLNGREVYHCIGTGRSLGAFDWFFKVRDKYETYIDKEGIFPHVFKRDVDEGGYTINQEYRFYQHKRIVDNGREKVGEVPFYVQDMLSSFYYARTLDYDGAKKGDIFTIYSYVDEKVFPIKIKYKGIKSVNIRAGKFKCYLFNPVVQTGRVFKHEEDCNFYITCDRNKIPLLIETKLMVGSIKMEITGYKGLVERLDKLD
jgi:hypothetical protein